MNSHRHPLGTAIAGVVLTGLGSGAAIGGGIGLALVVPRRSGEVGFLVAALGISSCLALLGVALWPLARAAGHSALAVAAVVATVVSLPFSYGLWVAAFSGPYESQFCAGGENSFCGLGVLFAVPTYGSLLVWGTAALPWLLVLAVVARRRRGSHESRPGPQLG
jgi:hypothetical protein